jgi:hypothetical protein
MTPPTPVRGAVGGWRRGDGVAPVGSAQVTEAGLGPDPHRPAARRARSFVTYGGPKLSVPSRKFLGKAGTPDGGAG